MDSLLQYDSGSSDSDDVRTKFVGNDARAGERHAMVDACSRNFHGQVVETCRLRFNSVMESEKGIDSETDYFSLNSVQDKSENGCGFGESEAYTSDCCINQCAHNTIGTYEDMWKQQKRYRSWDDSAEACFVPEAAGNAQQTSRSFEPAQLKDSNVIVIPYKSKRQKLVESKSLNDSRPADQLPLVVAEMVSTKKNFYVVHSKIQPYLFQKDAVTYRRPQKAVKRFTAHGGTVNRVKWCVPEHSHLLLSASMDRTVKIWNVFSIAEQPCVQTLAFHRRAVKDADWSSSGRQLVSCGFDRTARVSDVESGAQLCCCEFDDFVTCVKYHPVQKDIFVAGSSNLLKCWDARCPSKAVRSYTFKDKIGQIQDLCFLDDGNKFLSCGNLVARDSADRNVMVWDFSSGAVISNQIFHERYVCTRFCKHPHNRQFLAQSHGDYIAQFDADPPYKMNKCKRFEGHKVFGYDIGCDISPDGQIVASGSTMGQMWFYDYRSARVLSNHRTEDASDIVLNVVWHPVLFSTVAIGTWNGSIQIWQ